MSEDVFIVVRDAATVSSARRVAQVEPGLSETFAEVQRLIDAEIGKAILGPVVFELVGPRPQTIRRPRRVSSSCARCGGPAYVDALGMRVVRVAPQHRRFYSRKTGLPEMVLMRESYWLAIGSTGDFSAEHPTREGAIALWREPALAAERAK